MLIKDKSKLVEEVKIVTFEPGFATAFKDLNVEWISTYFKLEASDYMVLDNPQSYIIDNGGYIFVALFQNEPVGVCAMIKLDENHDYDFELAKMAVSPKVQGKKIGQQLGLVILNKARAVGAKKIFLESNTILTPALNLYKKLGFKQIWGYPSPYERANIQMGLDLD